MNIEVVYLNIKFHVTGEIEKGQKGDWNVEPIPDIFCVTFVNYSNAKGKTIEVGFGRKHVINGIDFSCIHSELQQFINENYYTYIYG